MNREELNEIYHRVWDDEYSPADLKKVAEIVEASDDDDLQCFGIRILGMAGAKEYAPLIATFLSGRDSLSLLAIAIRVLADWFEQAPQYLGTLKEFLAGISEDEDSKDLQLTALQSAGWAFRQTGDLDLLRAILHFHASEEFAFFWAAYDALFYATTENLDEMPLADMHKLRMSYDQDAYVARAERMIAEGTKI